MKRISNFILLSTLIFAPFHHANAKYKPPVPVEKTASKFKKIPIKTEPPIVIPYEYKIFEQAKKDSMLPKLSLAQIENHQRELKSIEWNTINRSLEKEIEDLYWAFEITRAEKLSGPNALNSWVKALNSLHQHKWIYVWTEATSAALVKACQKTVGKKTKMIMPDQKKDDKCAYLAKKVTDAFPKAALETQALKSLLGDTPTPPDATDKYDRLSQSYGEKTEKDEQAFPEILDHYLNHQDDDLVKTGKTFVEAFPKSMLRFRALFLMAERLYTHSDSKDKKEAENNYSLIINQVPYSYYAIVASERLKTSLRDRLSKDPLKISEDPATFKLNFLENESLFRLQSLVRGKKQDSVAIELDQFSRLRNYSTDFLIYLIRQANQANQDLSGFRFATEILQRKGEAPLSAEFTELIFPDRFPKEIADQSKVSQIDPLLVVSLMKQESGFKGGILSSSGAAGLMQLMPFTAIEVQADLHLQTLREPVKNIEIGTRYLASLLNDKFNGNVVYALAGYNAGPHRVAKWRKDAKPDWGMQEFVEAIPFKETRDYVMSILRNRYWYQFRRGLPPQSVFEAWHSP